MLTEEADGTPVMVVSALEEEWHFSGGSKVELWLDFISRIEDDRICFAFSAASLAVVFFLFFCRVCAK